MSVGASTPEVRQAWCNRVEAVDLSVSLLEKSVEKSLVEVGGSTDGFVENDYSGRFWERMSSLEGTGKGGRGTRSEGSKHCPHEL